MNDHRVRRLVRPSQMQILLPLFGLCVAFSFCQSAQAQFDLRAERVLVGQDPFGPALPRPVPAQGEEERAQENEPDDETALVIDRTPEEIKPTEIRLQMMDGSIITGELETAEIGIKTEFGDLVVPIERIRRLRPGLRSYPELRTRIATLIEELGANDFNTREAAHKELVNFGLKVRNLVNDAPDSENAERKRHLEEIRKALDELLEEAAEMEEDQVEPWIEQDQIVTDSFTILGELNVDHFALRSRYGVLDIQLADIREGDRLYGTKQAVNRSLTVSGEYVAALKFKSSRIRLEKGDQISVRASGQIVMSPWGSNSFVTPNGASNYGMYDQFPGGALIAKIGDSGKEFLIGERKTFTATKSGILYFAFAVQRDYIGSGYTYPGQYSLRIKVEPN